METTTQTKEVVQDLIKINNDRVEGFQRAGKDLEGKEADLTTIFSQYESDSRQFSSELSALVIGDDSDEESVAGALHRAWIAVKATFTGHDRKSVLAECERGEDAIKKAYKEALAEEGLSMDVRTTITRQQQAINAAHDKIKMLRDTAQ